MPSPRWRTPARPVTAPPSHYECGDFRSSAPALELGLEGENNTRMSQQASCARPLPRTLAEGDICRLGV